MNYQSQPDQTLRTSVSDGLNLTILNWFKGTYSCSHADILTKLHINSHVTLIHI